MPSIAGKLLLVAIASTGVVLAAATAPAQPATSASFQLTYQNINSAGGRSTSTHFALMDCLGSEPEAPGQSSSASFVLYAGCAAAVPGNLPDDDEDGDGVSNGVEAAAPNGGDGNDDGIPDETQGNVTSLPGAGGNGYQTLVACVDAGCMTACQARQVTALVESDLPKQNNDLVFPVGLLGFILDCASANVHILYHALDQFPPTVIYEKFGPHPPGSPTSKYYTLPGVTFGSEAVGADPAVATASFVLTDGAIGDATIVDGRIVDPGGPALEILEVPVPAPLLSSAGVAIMLCLLLLTAGLSMRRRRVDVARESDDARP